MITWHTLNHMIIYCVFTCAHVHQHQELHQCQVWKQVVVGEGQVGLGGDRKSVEGLAGSERGGRSMAGEQFMDPRGAVALLWVWGDGQRAKGSPVRTWGWGGIVQPWGWSNQLGFPSRRVAIRMCIHIQLHSAWVSQISIAHFLRWTKLYQMSHFLSNLNSPKIHIVWHFNRPPSS